METLLSYLLFYLTKKVPDLALITFAFCPLLIRNLSVYECCIVCVLLLYSAYECCIMCVMICCSVCFADEMGWLYLYKNN